MVTPSVSVYPAEAGTVTVEVLPSITPFAGFHGQDHRITFIPADESWEIDHWEYVCHRKTTNHEGEVTEDDDESGSTSAHGNVWYVPSGTGGVSLIYPPNSYYVNWREGGSTNRGEWWRDTTHVVVHARRRCVVKIHTSGGNGGDGFVDVTPLTHEWTSNVPSEMEGYDGGCAVIAKSDGGMMFDGWTHEGTRFGTWRRRATFKFTYQLGFQEFYLTAKFRPATNMPMCNGSGAIVFSGNYQNDQIVGHF